MGLDGKVAFITGGHARASVAASPRRFSPNGASVMLNGRSAEKGQAGAGARWTAATAPTSSPANVMVQAEVEAGVDATVERFGQIDILVNNAGGSTGFGLVHELADEAWTGTA